MSIPAPLLDHYRSSATTVAGFLRLTRPDGLVLGYTTIDRAVTIGGVVYQPGFSASAIDSTEGLAVDNLELTIIPDPPGGDLTEADLKAGRWTGARMSYFSANYRDVPLGIEPKKEGAGGQIKFNDDGSVVLEFRSLTQPLQAAQGDVTSKTCRDRLGGPRCRIDLGPYTVTGSITEVSDQQQVTDDTRTEADDWFGDGEFTVSSGENIGLKRRIKAYSPDGVFIFDLAFPFAFELGDTYTAIPGCRKRHERNNANPTGVSDCIDKFDNILNFDGEPDAASVDEATRQDT